MLFLKHEFFCANHLQHVEREAIYSAVVHIDWARDVEVPALQRRQRVAVQPQQAADESPG
jgi:hypothetical protein